MIENNYFIGSKNESFGPGGIQNAITDTLVRTKGAVDAKLINKNINENGIYKAKDDAADGYDEVTVNIVGENNCKVERQPADAELFNIKNAIVKVIVPDGYTMISDSSAYTMPYLREIELPSTITVINASAFTYHMEKIIIHKPKDSIPGAPWGATNAEIIWIG